MQSVAIAYGFKLQGSLKMVHCSDLVWCEKEKETTFEVTTQEFNVNSFESSGIEIEGDYDFGYGFSIRR